MLEVDDLSFRYRSWTAEDNPQLFSHISMSMKNGEKMLLLSPPDRGKSTLSRILCALVPKYQSGDLEGRISYNGRDLTSVEPCEIFRDISYISQNPLEQFIATSVEDEIAFPLESMGMERSEMIRRVDSALERWGLVHMRESGVHELSGGERKRLVIATTDVIDPSFIIFDEVFDDLDPHWRSVVMDWICESDKTCLVLSSRCFSYFDGRFDRYAMLDENGLDISDDSVSRYVSRYGVVRQLKSDDSYSSDSISCRDISVSKSRRHDSDVFTLSVPSFELHRGEMVSLIGPNGSGKSTFSRMLCGLDVPDSGTFSCDVKTLNTKVAYIFQNPDFQLFLPTVKDELSWGLKRKGMDRREIERKVKEASELFDLELDGIPFLLSYAKRKMLQIAIYYLLEREYYILDELDSSLDYETVYSIIELLRKSGAGIMIITHDMEFASSLGVKQYTIEGGVLR